MTARRRVWRRAQAVADGQRYRIMLDERPLRLPGGTVLFLRTPRLAEAVAVEWSEAGGGVVGGTFGAEALGLTRLAATLQERVMPDRETVVATLLGGLDDELLCYRATHPESLVTWQQRDWQPWLDRCRSLHGADLVVGIGVMPTRQPGPARAAMRRSLMRQDDGTLTALGVLVPLLGSLVLGLAVTDGALAPEAAVELTLLDALHQARQWGMDAELADWQMQMERDVGEARRFVVLAGMVAAQQWLITGRVQGVGYRMWLQGKARRHSLAGWVRNLADGRVEAVLGGAADRLASMREAALRGPADAIVDGVAVTDWDGPLPDGAFRQVPDAAVPEANPTPIVARSQ